MLTRALFPLVMLSLVVSIVTAQQGAPPPAQMKKFDRIIGDWTGTGVTKMGPDGPVAPWTSRSSARKVMGGHFVREVVRIDFTGPVEMAIAFINYYAWDATQERHVAYAVGNGGIIQITQIEWPDDHTMIQKAITDRPDQGRFLERWTTTFKDGVVHLEGLNAGSTGGFWSMVKGTIKPAENMKEVDLRKVGGFATDAPPEMKKLNRMAGSYGVSGWWAMAAGDPTTAYTGTEVLSPLFGGMVLEDRVRGEGYDGYSATVWDPGKKCYRRFYVNTWGTHGSDESGFVDGKYVMHSVTEMFGQRMAQRFIIQLDEKGKLNKGVGHTIAGAGPPFQSFESTYTLKGQGK